MTKNADYTLLFKCHLNIRENHTIHQESNTLRQVAKFASVCSWLASVENTKWLQHISGLMRAAMVVVNAVDCEKRPVLIHCSDGWDRTPQVAALAELLLDPYYRTLEVRNLRLKAFCWGYISKYWLMCQCYRCYL